VDLVNVTEVKYLLMCINTGTFFYQFTEGKNFVLSNTYVAKAPQRNLQTVS